jgi:D-alanyl-D-alanine carboxypeptidase/D-alanyl-D-alanine-endopeptidase (penicillin-binding protein 4)
MVSQLTSLMSATLLSIVAIAGTTLSSASAVAAVGATTASSVQSRVDSALRGIGASHVDYRIDIDGVGVLDRHASTLTAPASNEKLFTAISALHLLGPDFHYETKVLSTAPIRHHAIDGDLILVGAGDPTLSFSNLVHMAKRLHAKHLTHVTGHLIVDDTRYGKTTRVSGWKHKFVPEESGTVDAFSLNENEWRSGASFESNPTPYNARIWRSELKRAHITVAKRVLVKKAPLNASHLLTHRSASLGAIIEDTLSNSLNFNAEMVLREIGAQRSGHGSPSSGVAAVRATARQLHLPIDTIHDGSGLSYSDRSKPATLVAWLERARTASYYPSIYYGLPLSCRSGTLRYRLCGRNVAGRIRAKTGTLDHVSTLSGYFETKTGHQVTFSVLVSGFPNSRYSRVYDHVDAALAAVAIHG